MSKAGAERTIIRYFCNTVGVRAGSGLHQSQRKPGHIDIRAHEYVRKPVHIDIRDANTADGHVIICGFLVSDSMGERERDKEGDKEVCSVRKGGAWILLNEIPFDTMMPVMRLFVRLFIFTYAILILFWCSPFISFA